MKKIIVAVLLAGCSTSVFSQGLVNFFNNATTLISSSGTAIQGSPGTYYFALLTAPVGTTDPALFTFSGAYGTNQATAGRFTGGVNVPIPGWYPGTTRAFMVAGWSASKGHDWNSNWVIGFGHEWYVGALGFWLSPKVSRAASTAPTICQTSTSLVLLPSLPGFPST